MAPHVCHVRAQAEACRKATKRDSMSDLPRNVLCMRWSRGEDWAVLEANLTSKDFRILYSDPRDCKAKVWNVSCTYQHVKKNGQGP
jgi:hypothetical protein